MTHQRTLQESFSVTGKGLHTGLNVTATFKPATANTGIRFVRTDLEGQPIVPALAEKVCATERETVIAAGDAKVSTIEHTVSALFASGIDNCTIELNAPEMPILDGSAKFYVEAIEKAGIEKLTEEKDFFVVKEKMEFKGENGSSIILYPDNEFSVQTLISFDSPVLDNQFATLDNLADYKKEIASSRTFVFVREIEPLLKNGLIKGGDLDNAIVIYDAPMAQEEIDHIADLMGAGKIKADKLGYLNSKPLCCSNEPAKHKLLDVIGDLALIGKPIKGRVIATKPGHSINTKVAKAIRRQLRKQDVQAPIYNPNLAPQLNIDQIKKLLPHRWPFLLIDKVIEIKEKEIVAVKSVSGNEGFFVGHFPEEAIMPGVLIVEAMAQAGGLLILNIVDEPERYSTYFMKIEDVKFRQKVVPGDTIVFKIKFKTEVRRGIAAITGLAFVGEKIVAEATLLAQIIKNK